MKTIAYSSPFVPPEWIAAHGFQPLWAPWQRTRNAPPIGLREGVCAYAGAVVDTVLAGRAVGKSRGEEDDCKLQVDDSCAGVVLTTTCDQMRHAAALVARQEELPVFLINVPATWQTRTSRALYIDELKRLGRFLVTLGGTQPSHDNLLEMVFHYDEARAAVRTARTTRSPRQFAVAIAEVRGGAREIDGTLRVPIFPHAEREECFTNVQAHVPLAIVGGPLLPQDDALFDLIEQVGGAIVLDATEGGERTLPAAFDRRRAKQNPLDELCATYFDTISDVFRRPNTRLYEWLGREIVARKVSGIVFRRYVWCDLWHAELQRLKQWSPVPVLDADVADDDSVPARLLGRLEAFVEMLRQGQGARD
jgi:benzoyl-CoA reductase/2-hydroxyglutaryl-CoA dehydratase subunit BcrC/BadD/HgdB